LDALRILAAAGVFAYHTVAWNGGSWSQGQRPNSGVAGFVAAGGIFGVDLFFLISGTVIPMALMARGPASFIRARIVRLFPVYWFAVLCAVAIYAVLGTNHANVADVLVNLTMMQPLAGVGDVFAAQWTLWAEFRFYAVILVLCVIGISPRSVAIVAALWTPLAALSDRTAFSVGSELLVAPYAPLFAGGVAIFGLLQWGRRAPVFWLVLAENAAFAAAWTGPARARALASGTGGEFELTPNQTTIFMVLCFASVLIAAFARPPMERWRCLTIAAGPTYCLYLLHLPVSSLAIAVLSPVLSPGLVVAATPLSCKAVATGAHYLVELPGGRLLRRALTADRR
jgi:peptidoglycan/LPS O-acetylase OafA/YrhL